MRRHIAACLDLHAALAFAGGPGAFDFLPPGLGLTPGFLVDDAPVLVVSGDPFRFRPEHFAFLAGQGISDDSRPIPYPFADVFFALEEARDSGRVPAAA